MARSAVLYARVSTLKQQDEGFSIPAQLDLLRSYSERQGFAVLEEFVDVESAKEPGRRHFTRMLALLKTSPGVAILVEKTDRLYRSLKDYVTVEDAKVEIHFVKEGTVIKPDAHSSEVFMQGIKALMARHYVLNLGEETRKGQLKKAEMGTYPSVAPLGYLNQDKKVVPDPFRRQHIRQCFLWKGEGRPYEEVAELAYRAGLRSRKGFKVTVSQIHNLLTNELFFGAFRWKGKLYAGDHEPIVTKAEWDAAQNPRNIRPKRHEFAFRGLLTCAICGHQFTAETQKGHVYYHCAKRGGCTASWVREDRLASLLVPVVEVLDIDDELARVIRDALWEAQARKREDIEARQRQVAVKRGELETKLEALWEDRIKGVVSEEFYTRQKAKYEAGLEAVVEEEVVVRQANLDFVARGERLLELCKGIAETFVRQTATEMAALLRIVCSNLSTDGVTVSATYERPFDVLAERPARSNWLPRQDDARTAALLLQALTAA